MAEWLLAPIRLGFLQRALIESTLVGILCGLIGTYVVLRGMSFLGDAISHAVFPGIVVAFLLHVDVFFGGLASGLLTALGIGAISQNGRVSEDSAIGVLFVGAFSLGVVLLSGIRAYARDLATVLLGDILGVTRLDVGLTIGIGSLVLVGLLLFHKELVLISFDRDMAVAMGLPVATLEIGLLIVLSLVIIVSIQSVGTILVLAMLVTPAATARFLTERLIPMMGIAAGLGALAGLTGLYASYYLNIASGGAIVLVAMTFFFTAWIFSPQYGALGRLLRRPVASEDPAAD
jgi:ABC-type Mn2+/Zn2+ transport system permease subunit